MNFLNFKNVNSTYDLDRHMKDLAYMSLYLYYLLVYIYNFLKVLFIICNAVN